MARIARITEVSIREIRVIRGFHQTSALNNRHSGRSSAVIQIAGGSGTKNGDILRKRRFLHLEHPRAREIEAGPKTLEFAEEGKCLIARGDEPHAYFQCCRFGCAPRTPP